MAREDPQLKLRLPAELHEKLKAAAEQGKRSMNAEIVSRLEFSNQPDYVGEKNKSAFLQAVLDEMVKRETIVETLTLAELEKAARRLNKKII